MPKGVYPRPSPPVPVNADPRVKRLFQEIAAQQIPEETLGRRAGVKGQTLRTWRAGQTPNVANLEACFNVLGFTLQVVRIEAPENPPPAPRPPT